MTAKIHKHINFIWNRTNKNFQNSETNISLFIRKSIKLTAVIVEEYRSCQLQNRIYHSCLRINSIRRRNCLGSSVTVLTQSISYWSVSLLPLHTE